MKLFLSSAGIRPETKDDFLKLLDKNPKETKVAFIPTACDPSKDKSYVQWTIDQIEDLGMSLFTIDLKEETEQSLYNKLKDADVICVNGGNTFYLLDWVRKSGFDKTIKRLLTEGKVYFGVSAGSYIACPTIEMSIWKKSNKDRFGVFDFNSLNLINFLISVHYEAKYQEAVENGTKTTNLPVIALTDQQAVIINDNKISLAGPQNVLMFNNFTF